MDFLIKTEQFKTFSELKTINNPHYSILILEGRASFSIDTNLYECSGKNIVFLTPYQVLQWQNTEFESLHLLQFHGDYYCIEYHKKEVACNGILFNNIYVEPFVPVSDSIFEDIIRAIFNIKKLENTTESYNQPIIKTYLQLILALCSKEKQINSLEIDEIDSISPEISDFKEVLDANFIQNKSVAFYADYYALSIDVFSKKIKKKFGKTPSKLIQERMILEAKKRLHLTYKSIKEIANELGFDDEFYFSRYFKNHVNVSPKVFREKVGISIVAK